MKLKYILLWIFVLLSFQIYSQKTQRLESIEYIYETAVDLYENQMYGAAQKKFSEILLHLESPKYSAISDDAAYYIAMCALNLTNDDAQYLVEKFVNDNPESYNNQSAIYEMADYYFRNRRYRNALEWFEKVDRLSLKSNAIPEFFFKKGFSHFARRDFDKAAKDFYEVKDAQCVYGPMSKYFYSHIKYMEKQYQTALLGFKELQNNPLFSEIVPFYIVQIYYMQTKYDELIEYAPSIIEKGSEQQQIEINKLLGSSHFKKSQYKNAIPYLMVFEENAKFTTDYDNYELGFSLYMNKQYDEAVKIFSKIAAMKDTLSQNAAYHMADCHLQMNRKNEAKLAFETASRYRFNDVIREDALYNFAKLSFELDINPFNQSIKALTTYINEYPNSPKIDLVYNYLIEAFWSTKNYKDAIATIDEMEKRSPKLDEAYQRLTYYRGLELFTSLNYRLAINYFDKSIEHGQYNANLLSLAKYWKADALYRMEKYQKSIPFYQDFINTRGAVLLEEFDLAHYNLGYAYFDLKDYKNAGTWFRKFEMQSRDKESAVFNDALNRIGDCYYILRQFSAAAEYYKKSVNLGVNRYDYALYQLGMAYGGQRMAQNKIWSLSRLVREYPNSEYAANSTFEIGRSFNAELNNPDSAKHYFNILLTNYPNSAQQKSALASLAALYFNERNFQQSLDIYKRVIAQFPNTDESANAMEMIKSIYVEMNNTEEYFEYAENELEGVEITRDEQDSLSFTAAKNLYIEQKFENALEALNKFVDKYPDSRNIVEAYYYIAELQFHFENFNEAKQAYIFVADANYGIYTEQSTLRAAVLLYDDKDFDNAYKYYNRLYQIAENKSNKLIASVGELRSSFNINRYQETIKAAEKLIENDRANSEQKREAYYKMAKSYYALEENIRALNLFEKLSTEVVSYEGAEAKFRVAEIYYSMNNDSIAEKVIYDFAKLGSPQQYWIARSFILLSDIFKNKGDLFSAKHTLQSVLNNYTNETDGINDMASKKLTDIIEEEEMQRNTQEFLEFELDIDEIETQSEEIKNDTLKYEEIIIEDNSSENNSQELNIVEPEINEEEIMEEEGGSENTNTDESDDNNNNE